MLKKINIEHNIENGYAVKSLYQHFNSSIECELKENGMLMVIKLVKKIK